MLLMLGMVIGAAMMPSSPEPSRLLAIKLITTGVVIGAAGLLSLIFCVSRHRWLQTEQGLEVRQGLAILPRILARKTHVLFSDIAGVSRVSMGARETVELATRSGKSFRLMASSNEPIIVSLMAAASHAQSKVVLMREGLGFWASRMVMWLVVLAFVFSLIIAFASLVAV